jgi:hypothetical protein
MGLCPNHEEESSMSEAYPVDVRSVDGGPTALGWGGSATVVVDRPAEAGGRGLGFNGGQLTSRWPVASRTICFVKPPSAASGWIASGSWPRATREAAKRGIRLDRVRVVAESDYSGGPAVSTPIEYQVELSGDASDEALADLVAYVDEIAEIPNSIRRGTEVRLIR